MEGDIQALRVGLRPALAGAGAIAFSVFTAAGIIVVGAPGGNYVESDVADYVALGHFPMVVVAGYLALLGVLGLVAVFAYLREVITGELGDSLASNIFWGAGLVAAASFGVGWGLVTGIAVSAAEGGGTASIPHPVTYVLSDTSMNVLFGSAGIMLGFAFIALMLASRGAIPNWLRWLTLVIGVLAIGAPFYFPAFAIPIWGIVTGVWLVAGRRAARPVAMGLKRSA